MEKIFISGHSGFIGQHLSKAFPGSTGVSLRDQTWRVQARKSSIMINLVGKAHDHIGKATRDDFFYANYELTKQLYDEFLQSAAKLFVHISSLAAVEEIESNIPLTEERECRPISWYGESKLAAERYILAQIPPKSKKVIIIRPPMIHGAGDKGNLRLLYKLISKGIPYPLSSFENKRSFISIDNFCYFIEEIVSNFDKMESGVYHIADNESVSTNDIIKLIQQVTKRKVINISLPKFFIKSVAKIGDIVPIPLNSKRLKKMTSNLLVSNQKIKLTLDIHSLPLTAEEGLIKTIKSFTSEVIG